MSERILIVEDEETLRESLKRVFVREGYDVRAVESAENAIEIINEQTFDLIITDIILPGISGIELLRKCRELHPEQIVVIITAYGSLETAVESLRAGAYDYIIKPIIHDEITRIIRNAFREKSLKTENLLLKKQIKDRYDFGNIIGKSPAIVSLIEEVKKIADSKSNILILGETGTGKELFARAVHYSSPRKENPFIPINCSAIPDNLLESELFGYARGAFTGAVSSKKGLLEEADKGTVFLDEIGDLDLALQSKLLRVIDDREIRPIGSIQSRKVDVRFVSATNRDIKKLIAEGKFREDLYYRINVVTIKIPPLRERKEDIMPLVNHFLDKFAIELGKTVRSIDERAVQMLNDYDWPGNVRELQNIMERAVLISDRDTIGVEHLPEGLKKSISFVSESLNKLLSIEEYTKQFIIKYQSVYGEQKLSEMLGITRKSLWEKRKKWGIKREQKMLQK